MGQAKGPGNGTGNRSAVKAIEDAMPFFNLPTGQGPEVQAAATDGFQVANATPKPTPGTASLADFAKANGRNASGVLANDRQRHKPKPTTTTADASPRDRVSQAGQVQHATTVELR